MPDLDDAAGVRTHYEEYGSGDPVVLLHGAFQGGDTWEFAVRPAERPLSRARARPTPPWPNPGRRGPVHLRRIAARTLVVVADDDIVDHHHTVRLFETVPDAQLAVVPGTSHALPDEQPGEVRRLITEFLSGEAASG